MRLCTYFLRLCVWWTEKKKYLNCVGIVRVPMCWRNLLKITTYTIRVWRKYIHRTYTATTLLRNPYTSKNRLMCVRLFFYSILNFHLHIATNVNVNTYLFKHYIYSTNENLILPTWRIVSAVDGGTNAFACMPYVVCLMSFRYRENTAIRLKKTMFLCKCFILTI